MYEHLIVDGAWWDYVDEIATHRLALLLERHPAPMRDAMLAWSTCGYCSKVKPVSGMGTSTPYMPS